MNVKKFARGASEQETNILAVLRFDKALQRDAFRFIPFSSSKK